MAADNTLESLVREDVVLSYTDCSIVSNHDPNTLVLSTSVLLAFQSNKELNQAIKKRFRGKTTKYGFPSFERIVMWILSTSGYDINSDILCDVSNDDVGLAWEFLDTLRVSSSEDCRRQLDKSLGTRSSDGFRRSTNVRVNAGHIQRAIIEVPSTRPTMSEVTHSREMGHATIDDVLIEDALYVSSHAADPVGSAISIARSIRDASERSH